MSAGAEAVKRMLRDGKFYADISTDPVRYELAKRAADARKNRTTKAEFQAQFGLSAQKANEVWRDAGVLFTD
jgi:DNA polymerase-3 subunit epsilon